MSSIRQLAAIMFTDIVGYTAMMQRNEVQAASVFKHYNAVLEKNVVAHQGKVLHNYGDGSLCSFRSASEAIHCAIELQQQLQVEPKVPLRIGLHIGELFFEDGKALGDGVNIASRIQSLGVAGSVLLSKEVHDNIKNHPEFKAISLGRFEFKNVEEPLEVYGLTNDGLTVPEQEQMEGKLKVPAPEAHQSLRKRWTIVASAILIVLASFLLIKNMSVHNGASIGNVKKQNSIAVLYFSNMSGDPEQEYFSDGITEEIITRLSMIDELKVTSRTSVLQYKGKGKNAKQIARELGVKNILEGSVRKQGNKLRITAQLIDAVSDEHIWGENYDRELRDVFAVQSDIAQNIASKFQIKLSDETKQKLDAPLTLNTDAYDYYLKAQNLSYLNFGLGGEKTSRITAMDLLRKALQLDPAFAEAYALLSINFSLMSWDAKDPEHWIDSALLLAKAAIHYGPKKVDGYKALANIYETTGDIDEALKWLMKCDEIQPFSQVGYISSLYTRKGEYGKAMNWSMKAIWHDPTEPRNYISKASIFYELGMLDSMKSYINMAMKIKPDRSDVVGANVVFYHITGNAKGFERVVKSIYSQDQKAFNYNMAIFNLFQKQWKTADSLYKISTHPDDIDAALAKIHIGDVKSGKQFFEKALKIRLESLGYWDHWHYYDISRIYAALGDPQYIRYLQKALDKGWHEYKFFEQDPFFDFVRNTPEFKKITRDLYEKNELYKADVLKSLASFSN